MQCVIWIHFTCKRNRVEKIRSFPGNRNLSLPLSFSVVANGIEEIVNCERVKEKRKDITGIIRQALF